MTGGKIKDYLQECYPDEIDNILLADGLEEAFLGVVEVFGENPRACYDIERCIEVFMNDGMSAEEASEHFEFNVRGAYVGEYTPAFMFSVESV